MPMPNKPRPATVADFIRDRGVTPRPDCLIWPGGTDAGYGRIVVDGKSLDVHRFMWEQEHGSIPDGLTIDHLCRVRACFNTTHMELVTADENFRRAQEHKVSRWALWTHCKRGHEFTPDNTRIRPSGGRDCRECSRLRSAARRKAGIS